MKIGMRHGAMVNCNSTAMPYTLEMFSFIETRLFTKLVID